MWLLKKLIKKDRFIKWTKFSSKFFCSFRTVQIDLNLVYQIVKNKGKTNYRLKNRTSEQNLISIY